MSNKILIIGPAWVGDMVMAQSLFKLLKAKRPDAELTVLAPAWSLPLLSRMPEVSSSLIMPIGHGKLALKARYQLGKSLRNQFTEAIVLPNSFKSALIPWFARIPKRVGWRGEYRYSVLNDLRYLDEAQYPLLIQRYAALGLPANETLNTADVFWPALRIKSESQQHALQKYELMTHDKPILALCPGAEFGPAKRWPEEYYAAVAEKKLAEGWDVWLMGSPNDAKVAETIMTLTANRCKNLVGKTSLEEAIDLLSVTTGVICNDSGLMHIAAALNKPLIAVYGPTSTRFTPPLQRDAMVLQNTLSCQPCFQRTCPLTHHRCMRELAPEKVLSAITAWKTPCVS